MSLSSYIYSYNSTLFVFLKMHYLFSKKEIWRYYHQAPHCAQNLENAYLASRLQCAMRLSKDARGCCCPADNGWHPLWVLCIDSTQRAVSGQIFIENFMHLKFYKWENYELNILEGYSRNLCFFCKKIPIWMKFLGHFKLFLIQYSTT